MGDESDTDLTEMLSAARADPNDPLSQAAFEGPAVYADRLLVSERDGMVRISVAETDLGGGLHFRGAIAVSLGFAQDLSAVLTSIVNNAKARHGQG